MEIQWNPWHGCKRLSAGCKNCYVFSRDEKYDRDSANIKKNADFDLPIRKRRDGAYKIESGTRVATCFTSDFFLEEADEWRQQAWDYIRIRPDLKFFFLTKRIDRFYECIPEDWGCGWDNVKIGCTCEDRRTADYRLPIFSKLPIAHKAVACSPLLEEVDISPYLSDIENVAAAGESGNNARECRYEWILKIRQACLDSKVGFWFQQTGANFVKDGKRFNIARKFQHDQAKKAGINLDYGASLTDFELD